MAVIASPGAAGCASTVDDISAARATAIPRETVRRFIVILPSEKWIYTTGLNDESTVVGKPRTAATRLDGVEHTPRMSEPTACGKHNI